MNAENPNPTKHLQCFQICLFKCDGTGGHKNQPGGGNMRLTVLFVNRIPASKHKQGDVAALQ